MKATVAVLALTIVVATGCKKTVDTDKNKLTASAHCEVKPGPTVVCTVKQSDAKAEHKVCWDFAVTCPNGASLAIPHSCTDVNGSTIVERTVATERLTVKGDCQGEKTPAVTNITVDGKPVQ
jgi:hypothetical protein